MKLTAAELAFIRTQGLHVTEKCDGCGKPLNQSLRYTIARRPEVYCSADCRDSVFFRDRLEAKRNSSPGKCANCGVNLEGKRRGALYCDDICRKRLSRKGALLPTGKGRLTRTLIDANEQLTDTKKGGYYDWPSVGSETLVLASVEFALGGSLQCGHRDPPKAASCYSWYQE